MASVLDYPFYKYYYEDKSHYPHAKDMGYNDPTDSFLIGESGGFLLNINPDIKFINTDLLREAAITYEKEKKYTPFAEGSIPYEQFRKQETIRRMVGFKAPCRIDTKTGEVLDTYITGEHYNFLNYGRILRLDTSTVRVEQGKVVGKKILGFPRFLDAQYWYFLIKQFCRDNGYFLINDKTRRGGFSYIEAIDSANNLNLNPGRNIIHAAVDNKFLIQSGGLSDFMKKQMIFYESETPFKRGIAKIDAADFILGYRDAATSVVDVNSWNSACISVSTFNNPSAAVGKDASDIKCEEMSEFNNFDDFMDVTEPTLRTGSVTTGFLNAWGTAGKASSGWVLFEQNFYDPRSRGFMPFENVWDKDSRSEVCGYFKPFCWGLEGYRVVNGEADMQTAVDNDGNSDIALGYEIAEKERADYKKNNKSFSKYISYCGQYANMPAESFSSVSENIFSSELGDALDAWETELRMSDIHKRTYLDGKFIKVDDKVSFITNERIAATGGKFNVDYFDYIKNVPRHGDEHPHGCVRKWTNPINVTYLNKQGQVCKGCPPGIYSISYDPVGVNKDNKDITLKHSHNSIKVWMNPCVYNNYKGHLACSYYGRPETLEEADEICYFMALYYNCLGTTCVEVNRGETLSNFKKWKALRYLDKHPVHLWDKNIKEKVEGSYGYTIGGGNNGQVKLDALRMTVEMLKTVVGKREDGSDILYLHTIYDHPSVLELKKFNPTGNFDRVSELLIRGIEWASHNKFADEKLKLRQKIDLTNDLNEFWNRPWYQ